jgi:hypothetical protein
MRAIKVVYCLFVAVLLRVASSNQATACAKMVVLKWRTFFLLPSGANH